jgi:hypothetical protein
MKNYHSARAELTKASRHTRLGVFLDKKINARLGC